MKEHVKKIIEGDKVRKELVLLEDIENFKIKIDGSKISVISSNNNTLAVWFKTENFGVIFDKRIRVYKKMENWFNNIDKYIYPMSGKIKTLFYIYGLDSVCRI